MLRLRPTLTKLNCVICEIVFFRNRASRFRYYHNFRNPFYNPAEVSMIIATVEKVPADWFNNCESIDSTGHCKGLPGCARTSMRYQSRNSTEENFGNIISSKKYFIFSENFKISRKIRIQMIDINNNPPRFFNDETQKLIADESEAYLYCETCQDTNFGEIVEGKSPSYFFLIFSKFYSVNINIHMRLRNRPVIFFLKNSIKMLVYRIQLFRFSHPLASIWPKIEINSQNQFFVGIFQKKNTIRFQRPLMMWVLVDHNLKKDFSPLVAVLLNF